MENKIEVCRSYSQKVNLGNYQTADFFMSCKAEVDASQVDGVAKELYQICRETVQSDIAKYNNKELSPQDTEDKKEGDMQKNIDDKAEARFKWTPTGFERTD